MAISVVYDRCLERRKTKSDVYVVPSYMGHGNIVFLDKLSSPKGNPLRNFEIFVAEYAKNYYYIGSDQFVSKKVIRAFRKKYKGEVNKWFAEKRWKIKNQANLWP